MLPQEFWKSPKLAVRGNLTDLCLLKGIHPWGRGNQSRSKIILILLKIFFYYLLFPPGHSSCPHPWVPCRREMNISLCSVTSGASGNGKPNSVIYVGGRITGRLIYFLVIRLDFCACSHCPGTSQTYMRGVGDSLGLHSTSVVRGWQELWGQRQGSEMKQEEKTTYLEWKFYLKILDAKVYPLK